MSTKIYAKARFGLREDTLENWVTNNPVLEKGEPAVISDSEDSRWLKIGDGKTTLHQLVQWVFYGKVHFNKTATDRLYNLQYENECSFGDTFDVMGCVDFAGLDHLFPTIFFPAQVWVSVAIRDILQKI